jgi:hypothetical protein
MSNQPNTYPKSWVRLDDTPEALPPIDPALSAMFSVSQKGAEGDSALPIQMYGSAFFVNVDAPTVFARTYDMLDVVKKKGFTQEVLGGVRWHIQANWLLSDLDNEHLIYLGELRAFYLSYKADSIRPNIYEYSPDDEELVRGALELLSVKVKRVDDDRCYVEMAGCTQGGKALIDYMARGFISLWPEGSDLLREHFNIAPTSAPSAKHKGGRPGFEADKWAWEQVNVHKRPPLSVHKEWIERRSNYKLLTDPDRAWRKAIKADKDKTKERRKQ